jgi:dTDP-4-amino-4,6-dideoxygalactose transaminase
MMVIHRPAVEAALCNEFGFADAVLFGRGRSAIAALLEILTLPPDSSILIPSNVCPALLASVWDTGSQVRLLPVNRQTGLVDDAHMAAAINDRPAGLAIATQLYGYRTEYSLAAEAARHRNWFILENDTLATSARSAGERRSSFSSAMLISFGYTKTIEIGGGGALLTNDTKLADELRRRASSYPPLDTAAVAAEAEEMMMRRKLRTAGRDAEALLPKAIAELRYSFPENMRDPLMESLRGLANSIERRRETERLWRRQLADFGDRLISPPGTPIVPWRVIRRSEFCLRERIVTALRAEKFDVGTNYPPLADAHPHLLKEFRHDDGTAWGNEVLNFWVTEDYDKPRVAAAVNILGAVLDSDVRES